MFRWSFPALNCGVWTTAIRETAAEPLGSGPLSDIRFCEKIRILSWLRAQVLIRNFHLSLEVGGRVPGPAGIVKHGPGEGDQICIPGSNDGSACSNSVMRPTATTGIFTLCLTARARGT